MTLPTVFVWLLQSRKFWLGVMSVIVGSIAFALTQRELFVIALMLPFLVNMLGISIEDSSISIGAGAVVGQLAHGDKIGQAEAVQQVAQAATLPAAPAASEVKG